MEVPPFWLVLGAITILVLAFAVYYKLFPQMDARHTKLEGLTILYVEHQVDYKDLSAAFMRMMNDTRSIGGEGELRNIGLYFDDYGRISQKYMTRVAIGVILDTTEQIERAKEFMQRAHRYKLRSLPSVECIYLSVPFRNMITYFLMGFYWKRLFQKLNSGDFTLNERGAGIEIYDYRDPDNKVIELFYPLERAGAFFFPTFPEPKYNPSIH